MSTEAGSAQGVHLRSEGPGGWEASRDIRGLVYSFLKLHRWMWRWRNCPAEEEGEGYLGTAKGVCMHSDQKVNLRSAQWVSVFLAMLFYDHQGTALQPWLRTDNTCALHRTWHCCTMKCQLIPPVVPLLRRESLCATNCSVFTVHPVSVLSEMQWVSFRKQRFLLSPRRHPSAFGYHWTDLGIASC